MTRTKKISEIDKTRSKLQKRINALQKYITLLNNKIIQRKEVQKRNHYFHELFKQEYPEIYQQVVKKYKEKYPEFQKRRAK